jgi:hypothetical protein
MNRHPKKAGSMRGMPQFGARAKWESIAITASDPAEFAREYAACLNKFSSEGWNITGIMQRGEAVIITAQKAEIPPELAKAMSAIQNRAQARPLPETHEADELEEVTYNYQEAGECKSLKCASLEEAKGYLEEHAALWEDPLPSPVPSILPISIVVMHVTSYEPMDLPLLRALFPSEA